MVAGLVIAGVVASSVFAQDAPKKSRRRGVTYEQAKKADGTVDCASYCAAALKSVTDESKQEKAKSRAEGMFKRLATAAGAESGKEGEYVFKSEDDFKAAAEKVRASMKGKGRGNKGGEKKPEEKKPDDK
jgi:hypothetical protein